MAPVTAQPPAERSAWDNIVEKVRAGDEVIVANDDVVVVSMERYAKLKDAAVARVREEWDRRLACLNEPGSAEKLRKILDSTPAEIAAAASAAALRNKR